jgi:hypothetical protein
MGIRERRESTTDPDEKKGKEKHKLVRHIDRYKYTTNKQTINKDDNQTHISHLNGPGSSITERTDGVALNLLGQLDHHVDLLLARIARHWVG